MHKRRCNCLGDSWPCGLRVVSISGPSTHLKLQCLRKNGRTLYNTCACLYCEGRRSAARRGVPPIKRSSFKLWHGKLPSFYLPPCTVASLHTVARIPEKNYSFPKKILYNSQKDRDCYGLITEPSFGTCAAIPR